MSYSKLPVLSDDLDTIVPRFTASQLVRALLIVIGEDSQIKADDIDPRVFLCVGCVNRSVAGQRMMSFAWPDPEASEEDKLIVMLRRMMYPHRPTSPTPESAPAHTCTCAARGEGSKIISGSCSSASTNAEDMSGYGDNEPQDRPNLPYFHTWNPVDTLAGPPISAPVPQPAVVSAAVAVPALVAQPVAVPTPVAQPVAVAVPSPVRAPVAEVAPVPAAPMQGPFAPGYDYRVPYIAPVSDSTSWYVVSVGRRVGVFDISAVVNRATDGVPSNSRKCYPSRAAAIQAFEELQDMPGVIRSIDM
ncbi:hypothetical protein K466DRAFT_602549 [Polyporus arcularius HHB13444]|uniref:Uncharacterized protein n=1 Tax=Polyporus arcularius HHB13444 TaxID=1314778 RepID=A0A5C3P3G2_9APHY|nr:hypothetical protein K466DRAFT_602549 [Polyporus arcularius HHB13444]